MPRRASVFTAHPWPIVCVLLAVYGVMAWTSTREKSTAYDELSHLTAGYSYWVTGDYRVHLECGILPARWAALPLLASDVRFPQRNNPAWRQKWELGREFFYGQGNDADAMLRRGRLMIVVLGVLLGLVAYIWSRRLFGPTGGMISLILFTFSPAMLAHGSLITSDMAVSFTFLASLACCWTTLHRVSVARTIGSGLVMGALFVSKMSAVLMGPVGLILLAIRLWKRRPLIVHWRGTRIVQGRAALTASCLAIVVAHLLLIALVIWAFYGFQYAISREADPQLDRILGGNTISSMAGDSLIGKLARTANHYRLLPEPYLYSFLYTYRYRHEPGGFLHGAYRSDGWRNFFPYAVLIKTPLATFGLVLLALLATASKWTVGADGSRAPPTQIWTRAARGVYRTAPLWSFLIVYWLVAINTPLNIGHRHVIPTYTPVFILCGAAAYWFNHRRRILAALVVIALGQLVVESVVTYPHYLAYFNQLIGGPQNGYRHLVDSSLDWGQDLPGLKRWLSEERDPVRRDQPVYLSYFGTGSPKYYGLDVLRLPGWPDWRQRRIHPLEPGTYCISATMLQCLYLKYPGEWNLIYEQEYQDTLEKVSALARLQQQDPAAYERLLNDPNAAPELAKLIELLFNLDRLRLARLCAFLRMREPDDSVGYSILIYYLDENDLDMALNKSPMDWNAFYGHVAGPKATL